MKPLFSSDPTARAAEPIPPAEVEQLRQDIETLRPFVETCPYEPDVPQDVYEDMCFHYAWMLGRLKHLQDRLSGMRQGL